MATTDDEDSEERLIIDLDNVQDNTANQTTETQEPQSNPTKAVPYVTLDQLMKNFKKDIVYPTNGPEDDSVPTFKLDYANPKFKSVPKAHQRLSVVSDKYLLKLPNETAENRTDHQKKSLYETWLQTRNKLDCNSYVLDLSKELNQTKKTNAAQSTTCTIDVQKETQATQATSTSNELGSGSQIVLKEMLTNFKPILPNKNSRPNIIKIVERTEPNEIPSSSTQTIIDKNNVIESSKDQESSNRAVQHTEDSTARSELLHKMQSNEVNHEIKTEIPPSNTTLAEQNTLLSIKPCCSCNCSQKSHSTKKSDDTKINQVYPNNIDVGSCPIKRALVTPAHTNQLLRRPYNNLNSQGVKDSSFIPHKPNKGEKNGIAQSSVVNTFQDETDSSTKNEPKSPIYIESSDNELTAVETSKELYIKHDNDENTPLSKYIEEVPRNINMTVDDINNETIAGNPVSSDLKSLISHVETTFSDISSMFHSTHNTFLKCAETLQKMMVHVDKFCETRINKASASKGVKDKNRKRKRRYDSDETDDEDDDDGDNSEDDKIPLKKPKKYTFDLPPEYTPDDSRWTLKNRVRIPGITELIPKSRVYIDSTALANCKRTASDCKTLARMLLTEIFTHNALKVCSLTGARARAFDSEGDRIRPGLDRHARMVLLSFVDDYGREKGWNIYDKQTIINSLRNKIQELRHRSK